MEFPEAVRVTMRDRLFDYQGRARRSEYWWFWAFYWLIWTGLYMLLIFIVLVDAADDEEMGILGIVGMSVYVIANLALLLPGISVTVRRLHDLDRSGWWIVTTFIPFFGFFFGIMLLIWFAQPGTHGPNRFGLDPKGYEVF